MRKLIIRLLLSSSGTFCRHEYIRKLDAESRRYYLECMKCLKTTPGVDFGSNRSAA